MRIAVSGAHATGKTTLVAALASRLPGYITVDEPYYSLVQEGHDFSAPPTNEDFEILLEASLTACTEHGDDDVIFDRTPADYLAYLALSPDAGDTVRRFIPAVAKALASLDLVILVPIEHPDRIHVSAEEGVRQRRLVDTLLRDMLLDGGWGFTVDAIEVEGTPGIRAAQVLGVVEPVERR